MIYDDPNFIDVENYNFNISINSPCIDSGNPNLIDFDGTISDIGAIPFSNIICEIEGDINSDSNLDILDIVEFICFILNPLDCSDIDVSCSDLNNDDNYDILDIILLVNIILN